MTHSGKTRKENNILFFYLTHHLCQSEVRASLASFTSFRDIVLLMLYLCLIVVGLVTLFLLNLIITPNLYHTHACSLKNIGKKTKLPIKQSYIKGKCKTKVCTWIHQDQGNLKLKTKILAILYCCKKTHYPLKERTQLCINSV